MSERADQARKRQYSALRDGASWSAGEWAEKVERAREGARRHVVSISFCGDTPPSAMLEWERPVMFPPGTVGMRPELVLGAEAELAERECRLAIAEEEARRRPFVWTVERHDIGTWTVVAIAKDIEESLGVAAVLLGRCEAFIAKANQHVKDLAGISTAERIRHAEWWLKTYGGMAIEAGRGGCVLDAGHMEGV